MCSDTRSGEKASSSPSDAKVWDFPTRVFHWAIVILVGVAWATSEGEGGISLTSVHVDAGIAILALVIFRLIWGVIGSKHSRFSDFVRPWAVVRTYATRLVSFNPPRYLGHNPLGGWMVLALLAFLAVSVVSGLAMSKSGYVGPFAHGPLAPLGYAHEGLTTALLALAGVHVFGVLAHFFLSGENLVRAMFSGVKTNTAPAPDVAGGYVGSWRAALALAGAMAITWWWVG